jgi:hypothetical protein
MSDKSPKELARLIEQSKRLAKGSDPKTVDWLHKLTEELEKEQRAQAIGEGPKV